jgi:hypothetical protein
LEALLKAAIYLVFILANVIQVPPALTPQNGSSVVTSKDKRSGWEAKWGMEELQVQGKKAVRFTETGSGRMSTYSQEVRWSVESIWLAEGAFRPLDTRKTITAIDGKVLLVERKHFDHDKRQVHFERSREGKAAETKSLDVPDDTLAIEGLAGVLRFANVPRSRSLAAHVLTNEAEVYSVTFEWRDEESVKTAAGEFHCYKVEMIPHLGVLNVIRPFLQKTYFWFTVSVPHRWIRYQGPESGPGTPEVIMELSSTDH